MIAAHESLCSVVDPAGWAADAAARLAAAADRPLAESDLGRAYLADLRRDLAGVQRECEAAGRFVKGLGGFDGYVAHLRDLFQTLKHLLAVLDDHGLDAVAEVADGVESQRLKAVAKLGPEQGRRPRPGSTPSTRWSRTAPGGSELRFTEPQWRAGMRQTLPHAATLLSLVERLRRRLHGRQGRRRPRSTSTTSSGSRWPSSATAPAGRRPWPGRTTPSSAT